jgi:hypothetical protein
MDSKCTNQVGLLRWIIPDILAGVPMPFIHTDLRMAGGLAVGNAGQVAKMYIRVP